MLTKLQLKLIGPRITNLLKLCVFYNKFKKYELLKTIMTRKIRSMFFGNKFILLAGVIISCTDNNPNYGICGDSGVPAAQDLTNPQDIIRREEDNGTSNTLDLSNIDNKLSLPDQLTYDLKRTSSDLEALCYTADFTNPGSINDFVVESGDWKVSNGQLIQFGGQMGYRTAHLKNSDLSNPRLSVVGRLLDDGNVSRYENARWGIAIRYDAQLKAGYLLELSNGNGNATQYDVKLINENTNQILLSEVAQGDLRKPHKISIEATGDSIKIYHDNKFLKEIRDGSFAKGKVAVTNFDGHYAYDSFDVCG